LSPVRCIALARRSKLEVARHLGLAAPKEPRRPMSPDVHVDMAEEDVAAMLMTLPHAQPSRCAPALLRVSWLPCVCAAPCAAPPVRAKPSLEGSLCVCR
jgi:hypothetical protein